MSKPDLVSMLKRDRAIRTLTTEAVRQSRLARRYGIPAGVRATHKKVAKGLMTHARYVKNGGDVPFLNFQWGSR